MKTYVTLALAILTQAVGNVCLSKGMKELPSASAIDLHSLSALFSQAVQNPILWVGTVLLIVFFLLFAAVLSWADLTFVLPVISAEVIVNVAGRDEVVFADLGRALFDAYPGPRRLWLDMRATHNGIDWRPGLARWREMVEFLLGR